MKMNLIKWLGTILIILADIFRAYDYHMADMSFILVGTAIWSYTAWRDREMALLAVNIVCVIIMMFGIYRVFTGV